MLWLCVSDATPKPAVEHRFPLMESIARAAESRTVTQETIARLVDRFYTAIKADAVLGPIFGAHVKDWDAHMPKMRAFWSTVVLRTGTYAGRPVEAHERIPGLTDAHFARWLALWEETVTSVVEPAGREAFLLAAKRMAATLADRAAVR